MMSNAAIKSFTSDMYSMYYSQINIKNIYYAFIYYNKQEELYLH